MSAVAEHEWSDSRYGRPDVMIERYRLSLPRTEPGIGWTLVQHL